MRPIVFKSQPTTVRVSALPVKSSPWYFHHFLTIAHTLTKMEDGITLSVTLNVRKQHFLAISHILCDRMLQFAIKIPIHLHCNNIIIQNKFLRPLVGTHNASSLVSKMWQCVVFFHTLGIMTIVLHLPLTYYCE